MLQIWDTAGQERFQSLSSAFYRGAEACCLVFDLTNKDSFENMLNWKQVFLSKSTPKEAETFPFMVLGNKSDLEEERRISNFDAKKFCQQNGSMLYFETSAKNGNNVEGAFRDLIETSMERRDLLGGTKNTIVKE